MLNHTHALSFFLHSLREGSIYEFWGGCWFLYVVFYFSHRCGVFDGLGCCCFGGDLWGVYHGEAEGMERLVCVFILHFGADTGCFFSHFRSLGTQSIGLCTL